ncbi:MAG TPA: hypothetical protein PL072_01980 [Phycisphaerales bacterium]|nr:hypothetical protein [Phycisphaerales bacterium]
MAGRFQDWADRIGSIPERLSSNLGKGLAMIVLVVSGLLVLPILVAAAVVVVLAMLILRVRILIARWRSPNGPLDGRRNVRVRVPGEQAPEDV